MCGSSHRPFGQFAMTNEVPGDVIAWCVQPGVSMLDGQTHHAGALNATVESDIAKLYEASFSSLDLFDADEAPAYEVAIRELVHDTDASASDPGLDLDKCDSALRMSGDVRMLADDYLNAVLAMTAAPIRYRVAVFRSEPTADTTQDFVTATPAPLPAAG